MPQISPKDAIKEIAQTIVQRAQNLDMKRKDAEKMARSFFLGGSKVAKLTGNDELAQALHDVYSTLVETGFGRVEKLAGIAYVASSEEEPTKQAA